jgi:4-amino-4-deoxy-L-arabinose transferase-like glycosyltransferase
VVGRRGGLGQGSLTGARKGLAVVPLLVVIGLRSVLILAFAGRYGWQRDELYYWVAGHHLAGGYVDYPPVTALLSWIANAVFGASLLGFRLFTVVAGAVVVTLGTLVARDLGGGRLAQGAAAVGIGFSPVLLATNGLFQPVSFDQVTEMLLLYLALRLALRPSFALWPLLGVVVGVGLETKYTMIVVAGVLLLSFALFRRDALDLRGLLVAAAIAAVVFVPNLIWEARHGWISVRWFLHPGPSATSETRPQYLIDMLIETGVVAVPFAVAGTRRLRRDRSLRPLAATIVGTIAAYFVLHGKFYYAAPVAMFAIAAGGIPFERWAGGHSRRLTLAAAAFGVLTLVALPTTVPVLPLRTAVAWGIVGGRSDYQDEIGWPELAATVGRLSPGEPVVVAANYGEAGALALFGRRLPPVASGHMSFRYWSPPLAAKRGLVVGYDRSFLGQICSSYGVVGRIRMPHDVHNEERGSPIARCSFRGGNLAAVWPRLLDPQA